MAVALVLSVLSVAAGALLAMAPRVRAIGLGPIRTFALAAAGVAVLGHLLPEAVEGLGTVAILAFALALAAPWLIEHIGHRWLGDGHHHEPAHSEPVAEGREHAVTDEHAHAHRAAGGIAVEISFAALLLHQIGDGVGLHHYTAGDAPSLDAALALSLHTVPVAAVVVLRFSRGRSRRAGMMRALLLAVATLAGVALGATIVSPWLRAAGPWTAAIVSGLLLHVLAHDLGKEAPISTTERVLELGGLVAGLAVAIGALWLGADEHGHALGDVHARDHAAHAIPAALRVAHAMADVALAVAPWVLAALAISAILGATSPIDRSANETSSGWTRAVAGVRAMARSETAPMTVVVSIALLGWRLAIVRAASAVLGAAVLWALLRRETSSTSGAASAQAQARSAAEPTFSERLAHGLERALHQSAPHLVLGVVLTGLVHGVVPDGALDATTTVGWSMLALSMLAIAVQTDGSSATLVGAAFTSSGLSAGGAAALALLAGLRPRGASKPVRLRTLGLHAVRLAIAMAIVFAFDQWWPSDPFLPRVAAHAHGPFELGAAAMLGLLVLWQLYCCGLRAWIATVTGTEHTHARIGAARQHDGHEHHQGSREPSS